MTGDDVLEAKRLCVPQEWWHDRHCERRFTDIMPFDDRHIFLAPALDFFLISKLDPPQNSTYKGYKIADADEDVQP